MKKFFPFLIVMLVLLPSRESALAQDGQPLTIKECIQLALQHNSTLLNAERRRRVAGTQVTMARSGILPTLDLSLSSARSQQGERDVQENVLVGFDADSNAIFERRSVVQNGYSTNFHSSRLDFNLPIFDFGANWNRVRQASAAEESSSKSYESAAQNTILLVYQRYLGYLKERQLLSVNEEAAKSSEEQLKRTESMYEIGSVAQGDVFRARTTHGNDRINLITQQNQVTNARDLLNVVMGRQAGTEINIVDIEEVPAFREYTLDEVVNVTAEQNPELLSVRYEMRRAEFGKGIARTSFLPSFGVNASYARNHNEAQLVYGDFSKNWSGSIGVGVRWNLFNGFSDRAEVERQTLLYRIAEEEYSDRLRTLRQEAEQALLALRAWKEITAINSDNLVSAQEDLRLAQERYRVGAGTLLDIINAQANLTRARSTFIRAKYDSMIAYAQLHATMGVLQE
ncbi:MAG: TolC family protein [bacterium]